jgi:endogenous inhibitor of DNA gyrase (YacG/DUF329 family)
MRCLVCKKEVQEGEDSEAARYAPFCSERCRLIDLGNWAAEKYRVASETQSEEGEPQDED